MNTGSGGAWSRRGFLGAAAGAGAALWLPRRSLARGGRGASGRGGGGARNVVFMVADGMSAGATALLDHLGRYTGSGMSWLTRLQGSAGVSRAVCSTHSADSAVTDSAAASSAWSTGVKHRNGTLCLSVDGKRLEPMLERAKSAGKRTGCVTTTTITHATPAGWYASADDRTKEPEIGRQLLASSVDVALGGGAKHFDPAALKAREGLTVVKNLAGLQAAARQEGDGRILGLFGESHVTMGLDRAGGTPGLMDMSVAAIERLCALDGTGFVLQIEGGRVDHAAHLNDAAGLVSELREFDRVVAWVAEWARSRDDTLVIVTTDHGTANPGLTVYGPAGIDGLRTLAGAKHSMEWVLSRAGGAANEAEATDRIVAAIKEALNVTVDGEGRAAILTAVSKRAADPFRERRAVECVVGSVLGNELGVGWVSRNHTADHVPVLALGAGSEGFPGYVDNTGLHDWVCEAAGVGLVGG